MQKEISLAYLISRYPTFSHTFIQREIEALRQLDMKVSTISINASDIPLEKRTSLDQQAVKETFYVKDTGVFKAICSFFVFFVKHPIKLLKALFFGIRWAGFDLRRQLFHFFYIVEAI